MLDDLYNRFLELTGEPTAAATLVLAHVQSQQGTSSDMASSNSGLIGLSEAAGLLGYKTAGLRKLAKQGLIRYVQNGRGPIRFKRQWIEDYIASNNPQAVKRSPAQKRRPKPAADSEISRFFNPNLYRHNRFPQPD